MFSERSRRIHGIHRIIASLMYGSGLRLMEYCPGPLNEVRAIRRVISKECDDDPKKVLEFCRQHQAEAKRSNKYQFVNPRC